MSDELIRLQQQFAIYRSEYAILLAGAKECEARAEAAERRAADYLAVNALCVERADQAEAELAHCKRIEAQAQQRVAELEALLAAVNGQIASLGFVAGIDSHYTGPIDYEMVRQEIFSLSGELDDQYEANDVLLHECDILRASLRELEAQLAGWDSLKRGAIERREDVPWQAFLVEFREPTAAERAYGETLISLLPLPDPEE